MCNIRCSVKAAKLDSVKIKVKTNVMLYIKYCPIKKDKNLKVIFRKNGSRIPRIHNFWSTASKLDFSGPNY